jgi:hypothetical protein
MVNTKHFCSEVEAEKVMQPFLDAKPIKSIKEKVSFANLTDGTDALNKPGGNKAQISCGMRKFDPRKFEESLKRWTELVERYPGAAGSFFMFTWVSTEAMRNVPDESTCWSHRDCGIWRWVRFFRHMDIADRRSMSFVSGADGESGKAASESAESFLEMCQNDQSEGERAFFPNHTRVHKVEYRYRGDERRNKLEGLKKKWDPEGFFTRQFL